MQFDKSIPSFEVQHINKEEFQRFIDGIRSNAIAEATHRPKRYR